MRALVSSTTTIKTWITAATLYFVAAALTIHLTSNGRDIATLWPANAILVALLLADGRPRWKTILSAGFAANIAANLITRGSVIGPLLYGISNLVEIWLVTFLLRRGGSSESILSSSASVLRFLLVAGLVSPAASGLLGAFTAKTFFAEPFGKSLGTWIASDGLGLLVFTPFFLALFRGEFVDCFNSKSWLRRMETAGLIATAAAAAGLIFFVAREPLLFALFPPVMLVTFRVGRIGTKITVMLIAIIGSIGTMRGHGPIVMLTSDPAAQAHILQAFLAVLLLTCLPVAAEVTARARLLARLDAHDREMTSRALIDPLTGVLNRAGFEDTANALLPNPAAGSVSLIAIDFDYFKAINDRWGHQIGDRALKHVTSIIKAHTRPNDVIGRLGGDEFIVLLPQSDMNAALAVSERLQAGLRAAPFVVNDMATMLVSLSIGVASSISGEGYARLHSRADGALYAAKDAGRNRISKAA